MPSAHGDRTRVEWTGDRGEGTRDDRGYGRDHLISVGDRSAIPATAGIGAGRDPARYNPEELVVAALSSCHMLWYLHLCAEAGVVVRAYRDEAEGTLEVAPDGSGRFVAATLAPHVTVSEGDLEVARRLHEEAHRLCFVASSVNFPVDCRPTIERAPPPREPPR